MGGTYGMYGGRRDSYRLYRRNLKERKQLVNLAVNGKIILKLISNRMGGRGID
jgi:hypothetical protein